METLKLLKDENKLKWTKIARDAIKGWIREELVALMKLIIPILITQVSFEINFMLSLIFIGKTSGSVLETDAAGLAVSLIFITALSVVIGMGTALDTLCSQAFGLKQYKRVGVILQQGLLVIGISLFPICALMFNVKPFLLLIGQNSCVVELTSTYLLVFAFAVPFIFLHFALTRYLLAQSIVLPLVLNGLIINVIMLVLSTTFLYGLKLGFIGAVFAMTFSLGSSCLFTLACIGAWELHKQTWGGWSWDSLVDWWTFTKLAVPGIFMVGLEVWGFEIGAIIAGTINKTQLAIYVVTLNVILNLFMISLSIAEAVTVRVGNELGAGNATKAKRVVYVAMGITICEVTVVAVLLQALQYQLGKFFTFDEAVIQGIASVMKVVTPLVISDHIQCVMGGVLRGSGRQLHGAIVNLISFYAVGLSVEISLVLIVGMGAMGLWIGILCASVFQALCFIIILLRTDWEEESQKAMRHVNLEYVNLQCSNAKQKVLYEKRGPQTEASALSSLSKIKLLLFRGLFLIGGIVILIGGGVGNYFNSSNLQINATACDQESNTSVHYV